MDPGNSHFKEMTNNDGAAAISKRFYMDAKKQQKQTQPNHIMLSHLTPVYQPVIKSFLYLSHTDLVFLLTLLPLAEVMTPKDNDKYTRCHLFS